jgi:hypothetical protein
LQIVLKSVILFDENKENGGHADRHRRHLFSLNQVFRQYRIVCSGEVHAETRALFEARIAYTWYFM